MLYFDIFFRLSTMRCGNTESAFFARHCGTLYCGRAFYLNGKYIKKGAKYIYNSRQTKTLLKHKEKTDCCISSPSFCLFSCQHYIQRVICITVFHIAAEVFTYKSQRHKRSAVNNCRRHIKLRFIIIYISRMIINIQSDCI